MKSLHMRFIAGIKNKSSSIFDVGLTKLDIQAWRSDGYERDHVKKKTTGCNFLSCNTDSWL